MSQVLRTAEVWVAGEQVASVFDEIEECVAEDAVVHLADVWLAQQRLTGEPVPIWGRFGLVEAEGCLYPGSAYIVTVPIFGRPHVQDEQGVFLAE